MKRHFFFAGSLMLLSAPVFAQPVSTATTGMMSAADVGVSPLTGTSATDYVKMAADGDMYEIASSKLAMTKSKRADIKSYAKQMVSDHTGTTRSLKAALVNNDRKITPPSPRMSAENDAKIALLRKAPKNSFDDLYLQQQAQAHQTAWALHKGYATDGTDPALKQVASTAVPVIEMHLSHAKGMMNGSMRGM